MSDGETESLSVHEMKRKPVFVEITVETGHPEVSIDNLAGKLEDLGFDVERGPSSISDDGVAEGVKDYREYLEADRTELKFREKAKDYKKYSLIGGGITILIILLSFISLVFLLLFFISLIVTIVFYKLSMPKKILDNLYVRAIGKVYSGTKAREIRDSGHGKAGTVKTASTAYVHSELKFVIAGDSEISVERLRKDVGEISKYLQKV